MTIAEFIPASRVVAADEHARKVDRVVRQLRSRTSDRPVSFKKKAVSHTVPKPNDKRYTDEKIDLTELNAILEIDTEAMTCTAEPGVTFEELVAATLPHRLVPIVVPELPTITIGGAVSGCSLESMSFKHGGFHDTCLEYEVITASGDVLTCTPDNEHQLVFQMIHGSFGTLGVLSKLTFKLVPAKPYVRMAYETYTTVADYKAAVQRHYDAQDVDFMDGIIHSPTKLVLSLGTFVETAPYTTRYDWLNIYYQSTAERTEDYLTTRDYFFRYDNGVTNVWPKSKLGRLLLGRFVHSDQFLRAAAKLRKLIPADRPGVTLDVFLPFSKMDAFMEWYTKEINFFPLWFVPYKRVRDYEWVADGYFGGLDDEMFVDIAIYGMAQPRGRNIYREIEEKLIELQGIKTLISYNYYEPEEFWRVFNKRNYKAVKRLTDPKNIFRDLYSKTCRAAHGLDDVDTGVVRPTLVPSPAGT